MDQHAMALNALCVWVAFCPRLRVSWSTSPPGRPIVRFVSILCSALLTAASLSGCTDQSGEVGDGAPSDAGLDADADADVNVNVNADADTTPAPLTFRVVTFNTGTTDLKHDDGPDDGYAASDGVISDTWYGDGLAWQRAVDDTAAWFAAASADTSIDIVAFQEIFFAGDCPTIPAAYWPGFFCEAWTDGMPTVAQAVLGSGWQVACHPGKSDKCLAVRTTFGRFAGCDDDLCLEGLAGSRVPDCGGGARVARGVIELATGGSLTVVNIHGSSGISEGDQACRSAQYEQVFVDMGLEDGPGANGALNLVLGDLNTDPIRALDFDASARTWGQYVGEDAAFHYISAAGPDAPGSYAGVFDIDHVVSDGLVGQCWIAGFTDNRGQEHAPVTTMRYFDHSPVVCDVARP